MPFEQILFPFVPCSVGNQFFGSEGRDTHSLVPEAIKNLYTHEASEKKEIAGFQRGRQPVRPFPRLEVDKAFGTKDRYPGIFTAKARNVDKSHAQS